MNAFLSATERRALRRAVHLLDLDQTRFIGSVATGALGLGSAIGLSAVAAWMIARACQVPDVVALGVAPVAVRLLGISRSVLRYCERLLSHDTALRGMTSLRTHLYEILSASRTDTVAGLHRGDVLARVGADVDAVGDLVVRCYLPMAVAAAVCTITSAALALVHPLAGLALAACLLLAGIIGPLVTIRAAQAAELARQEQATDLSATVLTTLEGGSELRVSARLPRVMDDLAALETHLASTRDRGARPAAAAAAVDVAAMGLAVVAGLLIGVPAVAGGMDPVWLAVIALVPLAAFEATSALGPASLQLVASAGAATRIVDLIDRAEASRADAPSPRPLPPITEGGPRLRARALAVGWPNGPVVADGIDLDLAPGDRRAIVGPSGAGKTTLLLTLAGLLEPKGGELTLDGVSPWTARRADAARRITLTAEDAHIFATTVLENLRVADGALTPAQARVLLKRAGLDDWLAGLPLGLDTPLASDATTLSGGERRRLLLARALAAPAPLMVLDEPGEHLEPATADRLVADLLHAGDESEGRARGVLLVTHRLSALGGADEVLVLEAPESGGPATIARRGAHIRLAARNESYRWSLEQETRLR